MQQKINQTEFSKLKLIGPLGNVVYALWYFFDLYFVAPNFLDYCLTIRLTLPLVFIPFYFLPEKLIVKNAHYLFTVNFLLGFTALLPIMLHTEFLEAYMVCSFLVPFIGSIINTQPLKLFLSYPLSFTIFIYSYSEEIFKLPEHISFFLMFYGYTFFFMTAFIIHFNYKNIGLRLQLEEKIFDSLEEKSSLVRILTHDISNVLTVLGMNFSVIKMFHSKDQSNKMMNKCVDIVDKSAVSLGEIVDKVKEMESIDGGKKALILQPTNIYKIVELTTEFLQDQFKKKDVELEVITNGLDWVDADIDATVFRYNVLNNLLTNALKFSNAHSKVVIEFERQDHYIVLKIRDFGIGIPKYLHESIFDPGKKSTRKGTSGEAGTGFGMPLAYSCTLRMNGTLRFESIDQSESPDNSGTTFFICFPIVNAQNLENAA